MTAGTDGADRPVRVTVLGPTTVGGASPTPAQRRIVAALVLRRDRGADVDQLVDAVWGERPPRSAVASLQNQITRLRRAHGEGLVTHDGARYRLDAVTDVARFEDLVAAADPTGADGAPARLGAALDLWGGSPYADLEDHGAAQVERARLTALRWWAMERWASSEMAAGDPLAAAVRLAPAAAEDPFQERVVELLVTALHLGGRRADAMAVLQQHLVVVGRELGSSPPARWRELARMLRDDVPPEPHGPATAPGPAPPPDGCDRSARPVRRCRSPRDGRTGGATGRRPRS